MLHAYLCGEPAMPLPTRRPHAARSTPPGRPHLRRSSKAAHRLVSLLRSQLGMELDEHSPRLFASLIPPNERKIAALRWVGVECGGWVPRAAAALSFLDGRRAAPRLRWALRAC